MEEERILQLRKAGMDVETTLERFAGNRQLYESILQKFPEDDSFSQIETALSRQDWEAAHHAAHTLKGVAGNLGMERLFQACSQMVILLREGRVEETASCYQEIKSAYGVVIDALGGKA